MLSDFHRWLGDARVVVDDMIAEEDRVVAAWTASGVQRGALFGFPPTNKPVSLRGMTVLRVRDGQVSEYRSLGDFFTVMTDLGFVPAPAPTTPH